MRCKVNDREPAQGWLLQEVLHQFIQSHCRQLTSPSEQFRLKSGRSKNTVFENIMSNPRHITHTGVGAAAIAAGLDRLAKLTKEPSR